MKALKSRSIAIVCFCIAATLVSFGQETCVYPATPPAACMQLDPEMAFTEDDYLSVKSLCGLNERFSDLSCGCVPICGSGINPDTGEPLPECMDPEGTPIVISVEGGYNLTGYEGGVDFDINGDGLRERTSWTADGSNGWLVLDRTNDGRITGAKELFGNFTPQPSSTHPNGFLALAAFDNVTSGGNSDGKIDSKDMVFSHLALWLDANHNGKSEPTELFPLEYFGITAIHLQTIESRRTDVHGNQFRYRAKLDRTPGSKAAEWAYDVILTQQPR